MKAQAFTLQDVDLFCKIIVYPFSQENSNSRLLSPQDQMYMYELCGHVIVNNSQSQSSIQHMTTLLRPLVQDFNHVMSRMSEHAKNEAMLPASGEENEEKPPSELCAETLTYAMGYARLV